MEFVIVGGDAAGMSAAGRAKRNIPDLNVTVLEKSGDVSYSACGLPYNIADPDRSLDELVVRQAEVFRKKQNINLLTGHRVDTIDREAKTVGGVAPEGKTFRFSYDKLLIATGASPVFPKLPGIDTSGVMALKSLEDGRRIKSFLKANSVEKVIVVGMGYIALEMCESLRARNIEVEMVDISPVFLPWMDKQLADVVKEEIKANGIGFYLGRTVERIEPLTGSPVARRLKCVCADLTLQGDMVLVAVGVHPNSDFAAKAGIELGIGGAIAVGKDLRTSDENIFAAGDCADAYHVVTGEKTYIPLALRANRAGWAVADNVCGEKTLLPGIAGTAVFKVFDLEVARTGLNADESMKHGFDSASVFVKTRSRAHAHPGSSTIYLQMTGDRKTGRLLGVQMVGREGAAHRINAAAVALHSRMTVEEFAQTDLAYAPPFGPVWDPLLTTANQLLKKL
ncbi:MAG: FAD-dependent oxidoreductase [Proteobacteria bacterium]|nr:FAD-dependent oxidoreductase [Pseudomonadota bacterium]